MIKVNLAYYENKDWEYLLSVISDKEEMPESWDERYKNYQKAKINLIAYGFFVREVMINEQKLKIFS